MTRCLGRWLGLTPEQPAYCLRGFPECPRAAPSRVGDPSGLGRRGGAQGAARGAIREKRYNLFHPDVQHTDTYLGSMAIDTDTAPYEDEDEPLTDDDIEWDDLPAEDVEALAAEAEADALL